MDLAKLQELQRLTLLHMAGVKADVHCSTLPDFSRFTALQHLHINSFMLFAGAKLQPKQLAGLTGLQSLHLQDMGLEGGDAGGAELLGVLPQLSSLTHLGLVGLFELTHCPAAAAERLSFITSSSRLQHLELVGLHLPGQHGDEHHPWQHIFSPNKQLLQLTSLKCSYVSPPMTPVQLQACVSCCPNLQELNVVQALADSVVPHALLQLSGLTSLTTLVSDAGSGVLAQLTGLQELSCSDAYPLTQTGLLQLTALKQLVCLHFADQWGQSDPNPRGCFLMQHFRSTRWKKTSGLFSTR